MGNLDAFDLIHSLPMRPWARYLAEEHSQKLKAAVLTTLLSYCLILKMSAFSKATNFRT